MFVTQIPPGSACRYLASQSQVGTPVWPIYVHTTLYIHGISCFVKELYYTSALQQQAQQLLAQGLLGDLLRCFAQAACATQLYSQPRSLQPAIFHRRPEEVFMVRHDSEEAEAGFFQTNNVCFPNSILTHRGSSRALGAASPCIVHRYSRYATVRQNTFKCL